MGKRGLIVTGVVVVVAAVAAAVLWLAPWDSGDGDGPGGTGDGGSSPAEEAAEAFARAWTEDRLAEAPVTATSGDVAGTTRLVVAGLRADGAPVPEVTVTSVDERSGGERATARAEVTWELDGGHEWTYTTFFPLVLEEEEWKVAWQPVVIERTLKPGEVLRAARTRPARAAIVDAFGLPLTGGLGDVVVGIQRSRTSDVAGLVAEVARLTGADPGRLQADVDAAGPDDFVEVVTMPRADYERIRPEIQPLPGTVFRELESQASLPPGFARAVLGATGPATAEMAAESEGRIVEGDVVGTSGIQQSHDEQLAGTPGVTVQVVPTSGGEPRNLADFPGTPGTPVAVTLDRRAQLAADAAVADTPNPSALVAVRVSTGDVLAVSNGPENLSAYNRAMVGTYPPGSVFKVPTTLGLLANGLDPEAVVDCPPTLTVGKVFRNAEGGALGSVPFRVDFAKSCNTAFVAQAEALPSAQLSEVAASLGYRELELGTPARGGSVPVTEDRTEHAAQMIGQGKVLSSPLAVALASASVGAGRTLEPRLVIDPAAPEPAPGAALPVPAVDQLRGLMRAVVTEGTGEVMADTPGGEVFGKTGTAEYGTETPPRTHAWFTGYQGDVAFAVLVEDGGFGSTAAAPVAKRFLSELAASG